MLAGMKGRERRWVAVSLYVPSYVRCQKAPTPAATVSLAGYHTSCGRLYTDALGRAFMASYQRDRLFQAGSR